MPSIEQWMRRGSGALMPRVHNFCDEWFYAMDGAIEFTANGAKVAATAGHGVWVGPRRRALLRGDGDAHVLNGYTPAGFEHVIKQLAAPAQRRELPPEDLAPPDERTPRLIFNSYWCCEAGAGWEQTTVALLSGPPRRPAGWKRPEATDECAKGP